ncbi:DUF1289 domain-containing protein [Reinekea marinisedimentorum]|uniref:Fe-S protein YdhL (DUF1289 family) n=1 Tax=Reinekea marinisedimentorum TaxID=230495 RepID=A0A4R3I4R2_9GAMM|nr:DUF1289 domain-containing protein [Reinekea marinisedimentorum]TCS38969.1 hypothetical protein BCF53_11315 [Reinekea marinisedimentorum]
MFINNSTAISPCISQCKLDEQNICKGCFRTRDEISSWMQKTEDEKIAITLRCKKKMAQQS